MRIVCVEGCHGCGKTTVVKKLAEKYNILDEYFLDMPKYDMPPQGFTIEVLWLYRWIERVLMLKKIVPENTVLFADRSPYSVLFYAPNGRILEPMITELLMDLLASNIEIITVYIRLPTDVLWQRITERLKTEPERIKYKEDSFEWMKQVVNFYETHSHLWTFTTPDNTACVIEQLGISDF